MRYNSNKADQILDKEIRVLDHGFVKLVDYMGNDTRVVEAARVSYGRTATSPERDAKLIDFLMKNHHTSPFEQVVLTFHIKLPIYCMRQLVRHRTARLNEISGRYSVLTDEWHTPKVWRIQDTVNKQGSLHDPGIIPQNDATELYDHICQEAFKAYKTLLEMGISREQARQLLPLSTYTQIIWQMDLHNLFHFLHLRMDEHAQEEMRLYANAIFDIAQLVAPISCRAFEKYILNRHVDGK